MAKLMLQRRGRGTSVFRAKKKGICSKYCSSDADKTVAGEVMNLEKDNGGSTVMANIEFNNGNKETVIAAEGLSVGQKVSMGLDSEISIGNTLPLSGIPEGCPVFNIELVNGDGGKLVRGSGMYAILVSKEKTYARIKLPSGNIKNIPLVSRASIGCCSGGGRKEKPMVKAGAKFKFMKAKSRKWPRVRGVAMNASDHPFGGEQHHAGKSKSTSRHASPGRKVGAIASKRTGRKKK